MKHVTFYLPQACDTNTASQAEVEGAILLGMEAADINTSKVDSVWFHCGSFVVLSAFPNEYADEAELMISKIKQGIFSVDLNGQKSTATLAVAQSSNVEEATVAPQNKAGDVSRAGDASNTPSTFMALLVVFSVVLVLLVVALVIANRERRLRHKAESTTAVCPMTPSNPPPELSWDSTESAASHAEIPSAVVINTSPTSQSSGEADDATELRSTRRASAAMLMAAKRTEGRRGAWGPHGGLSWDDYNL